MTPVDLGHRYQCIRPLGSGGLGSVFLVLDTHLEKELALKLLHRAPDSAGMDAFQREFALLSRVRHPGMARAHDFGYLSGRPYFTMEFIPGEILGAKGPLDDPRELLAAARDLAETLAFLHRAGILHLDIKPSNIIVPPEPSGRRAVLVDFGLFREGGGIPSGARGSRPYMAPEYWPAEALRADAGSSAPGSLSGAVLGPWTDVYAMGVTLYRVSTGRFPRPESGASGFWDPAPLPPSRLSPGVPADLDHVILKCLALDPSSRFPSAAELLEALQRSGASASPATGTPGAGVTVGRKDELERIEAFLCSLLPGDRTSASGTERSPVLLVTGPAGSGQSHLFREAKVLAQTRGLPFCLEAGYPGLASTPGSLLRALGLHVAGPHAEARSRWESFLQRLARPRKPLKDEASEGERRLRRAGELALLLRAIRDPVVLAVDGLQHWDEVSIGLLSDLVRILGEEDAAVRPPLEVIVGCREEGRSAALIRELVGYLLEPGKTQIITLRPLDLAEAMELHERLSGHRVDRAGFLSMYAETGGLPARIEASSLSGALKAGAHVRAAGRPVPGEIASGAEERRILLALGLLGRPCSAGELCRLARIPARSAGSALAALKKKGLALPVRSAGEGEGWLASPSAEKFIETAGARERLRFHRRMGRELCAMAAGESDPRLIEGARHLSLGGAKASLVRYGLRAARYLQSTYQSRAALDLFRSVLGAMARGPRAARQEVAFEMAEILGRTGEIDEGIRTLQEFLEREPDLPSVERARVILKLAALHTRRGDFQRAESLFTEGSRLGGGKFDREERLFFLNEYAALKVVIGEHEAGSRLCEEGLRIARMCRSARAREVILNLHATKANIAIRTFDHAAAVREHEEALRVAEATSSPNHAVILNNLAIAYGNCDRYAAAIRALREAEELSARLDEGPSLVSIHCNLAVLLAKTGDFKAMAKALDDAEKLSPKGIGIRQQLFLEHARGLSWLHCGRHSQARPHLEAAVELAGLAGDKLVAAFDEVYRAESLIFEGSYGEAASQLERLSEPPASPRIRKLALARLAFLSALTARLARLGQAIAEHVRLSTESQPVPFLDAWDDVYIGWALAIAGAPSRRSRGRERGRGAQAGAELRLGAAERFFRRHGLRPGAAVAALARAESAFLEGDGERAREILESSEVADHELAAVLRPLLEARLAMDRPEADSRSKAADLLSEAGAALVGRKLPEWSARLEALRWLLRGKPPAAAERRLLARGLPESGRSAYTRSAYWKVWTREPATHPPAPGRMSLSGKRGSEKSRFGKSSSGKSREPDSGSSTTAGAITREVTPARHRPGLVAKSEPMRRLVALLDRVAGADLPVLIEGETGTGKEMVARIIHAESKRSRAPLLVADCAAIPPGLLEAELFGARAGAFTDLTEDRLGLLSMAAGGTILVEGVAGMPLDLQGKLLRALGQGTFRRLGDEKETRADARLIFSTALDLDVEAKEGRFRSDLLHRIKVLCLKVPPLRERPEDLPELVDMFLREGTGPPPVLERGVIERLRELPWPGNVRELKNLIARLHVESPERISIASLEKARGGREDPSVFPRSLLHGQPLSRLKDRLERDYVLYHLARLGGDTTALSRFLGLSRQQFYRRVRRLGIRLRGKGRKHGR